MKQDCYNISYIYVDSRVILCVKSEDYQIDFSEIYTEKKLEEYNSIVVDFGEIVHVINVFSFAFGSILWFLLQKVKFRYC